MGAAYVFTLELSKSDVSGVLEAVESCGWRLHHAGYVYQPLKQKSHPGASMTVIGELIGVYTFVRPDAIPATP